MDDAFLQKWLDGAFEFACERRVAELVDVERVLAGLDAAVTAPRLTGLIARMVAPARERLLAKMAASELKMSAWLPQTVQDTLAQLLGMPARIPKKWIDQAVADERVRDQVRQTMYEALSGAVEAGFRITPGGRGIKGMMGLASAAGRGIFGGIGDEIQRQIQERLKDLVDAGVSMAQKRVAEKLASDETATQIGKRRRRMFLDFMTQSEKEVAREVARAPHTLIEGLAPVVIEHNWARAEVRAAVRDEVAAAVAELSKQTIGELLDELGLRAIVKEAARAQLLPLARDFIASQHFHRS